MSPSNVLSLSNALPNVVVSVGLTRSSNKVPRGYSEAPTFPEAEEHRRAKRGYSVPTTHRVTRAPAWPHTGSCRSETPDRRGCLRGYHENCRSSKKAPSDRGFLEPTPTPGLGPATPSLRGMPRHWSIVARCGDLQVKRAMPSIRGRPLESVS